MVAALTGLDATPGAVRTASGCSRNRLAFASNVSQQRPDTVGCNHPVREELTAAASAIGRLRSNVAAAFITCLAIILFRAAARFMVLIRSSRLSVQRQARDVVLFYHAVYADLQPRDTRLEHRAHALQIAGLWHGVAGFGHPRDYHHLVETR